MNNEGLNDKIQKKLMKIKSFFSDKIVVVAFSGGVDSTVVMELAHQYSKKAVAVTADSITILPGEIEKSIELASKMGYNHRVIKINELENENFVNNPSNRCYYCKSGLVDILKQVAFEIEADVIAEGTNISEIKGHRPGLQAIKENDVDSPLLEFGLNKSEIRQLANHFNLPNSEKPSLACLSSRFPTGVRITAEKLKRLGLAERYIIDTYDISVLRVRDHDGLARIEVSPEEREKLLNPTILDDLSEKLKSFGFFFVSIDCSGYKTGSLSDVNLRIEKIQNIFSENDVEII